MTPCTGQSSPSAVDVLCCSFLWCDCCGALVISLFCFVVSLPFLLPAPVSFANTLHSHWPIRGAVVMSCSSFLYCGCCGALFLSLFWFLVSLPPFLLRRPFLQQLTQLKKNILCNNTTQSQPGKKKKKKKRSDANIQARVKIDMECQIRKAQQAEAFKINGQAKWAEGWNRKNNLKGATTEGIKARQEEIQMANRELVILRKARMQKLYEEDLKGYVYSLVV